MPIFELGRDIPVRRHVWKVGSDWLSLLRIIIWIFQGGGGGGQKSLLEGLHVSCDAHFRTCPSYFSQKSCVRIWFGLAEPFKSYRVHKIFWGVLYLTCDAHFRTRMCYSIQKSCVKIWFGLVEIEGMLILKGAKDPLLVRVTGDLWFIIFNLVQAILDKSHLWKFDTDWLSLSRVIVVRYKKKKIENKNKTKSQTQLKTISLRKILSVRMIIIITSKASQLWSAQRGGLQ